MCLVVMNSKLSNNWLCIHVLLLKCCWNIAAFKKNLNCRLSFGQAAHALLLDRGQFLLNLVYDYFVRGWLVWNVVLLGKYNTTFLSWTTGQEFFRVLILSMKLKVNAVNIFPTYKLKQGCFGRSNLLNFLWTYTPNDIVCYWL